MSRTLLGPGSLCNRLFTRVALAARPAAPSPRLLHHASGSPAAGRVPNAANPDQRLKLQRPGAPGLDEYTLDSETQESDGDLRHLRGHVHLESIGQESWMPTPWITTTTPATWRPGATSAMKISWTAPKLNCDHAKYNVNTETGIFYDVRGTSETKIVARPGLLTTNNPFYFEGKWGERIEGKYIIHEGFVTDCKVPKPWWRLTVHQIRHIFPAIAPSRIMPCFASRECRFFISPPITNR